MKRMVLQAMVGLALALAGAPADAKGGGKQCPAGVTFQDCYNKCLSKTGADQYTMIKCSRKCARRGCE